MAPKLPETRENQATGVNWLCDTFQKLLKAPQTDCTVKTKSTQCQYMHIAFAY